MENLSNIPEVEKKHYMHCSCCNQHFDMRDLGEVFLHQYGDCAKCREKPNLRHGPSKRVGDAEEFLSDENKTRIDLN